MEQELKYKLRFLRENAGHTQQKICDEVGISIKALQNYESGASFPSVELLERILAIYDKKLAVVDKSVEEFTILPAIKPVPKCPAKRKFSPELASQIAKHYHLPTPTLNYWLKAEKIARVYYERYWYETKGTMKGEITEK